MQPQSPQPPQSKSGISTPRKQQQQRQQRRRPPPPQSSLLSSTTSVSTRLSSDRVFTPPRELNPQVLTPSSTATYRHQVSISEAAVAGQWSVPTSLRATHFHSTATALETIFRSLIVNSVLERQLDLDSTTATITLEESISTTPAGTRTSPYFGIDRRRVAMACVLMMYLARNFNEYAPLFQLLMKEIMCGLYENSSDVLAQMDLLDAVELSQAKFIAQRATVDTESLTQAHHLFAERFYVMKDRLDAYDSGRLRPKAAMVASQLMMKKVITRWSMQHKAQAFATWRLFTRFSAEFRAKLKEHEIKSKVALSLAEKFSFNPPEVRRKVFQSWRIEVCRGKNQKIRGLNLEIRRMHAQTKEVTRCFNVLDMSCRTLRSQLLSQEEDACWRLSQEVLDKTHVPPAGVLLQLSSYGSGGGALCNTLTDDDLQHVLCENSALFSNLLRFISCPGVSDNDSDVHYSALGLFVVLTGCEFLVGCPDFTPENVIHVILTFDSSAHDDDAHKDTNNDSLFQFVEESSSRTSNTNTNNNAHQKVQQQVSRTHAAACKMFLTQREVVRVIVALSPLVMKKASKTSTTYNKFIGKYSDDDDDDDENEEGDDDVSDANNNDDGDLEDRILRSSRRRRNSSGQHEPSKKSVKRFFTLLSRVPAHSGETPEFSFDKRVQSVPNPFPERSMLIIDISRAVAPHFSKLVLLCSGSDDNVGHKVTSVLFPPNNVCPSMTFGLVTITESVFAELIQESSLMTNNNNKMNYNINIFLFCDVLMMLSRMAYPTSRLDDRQRLERLVTALLEVGHVKEYIATMKINRKPSTCGGDGSFNDRSLNGAHEEKANI